jgi:RNA polymerase sigma-70 factor (ECF subfamily)
MEFDNDKQDELSGPEASYTGDPGTRLMLAYQGGDESAFDDLVEQYSGRVYALLTRFLGTRERREDLVQEVFLRVIRARERYQPTARFSTWLYRIVFNLSVNESQRAGAKEHRSLDHSFGGEETSGPLEIEDGGVPDPSSGLEQDDVVRAVRQAISLLPETQRIALILAKYHDQPYAEIATVLDSSEKAVKSLIHRARETLRTNLAPFLKGELT